MSRHVVGYEGVGKSRRPIYADEGPASSAVSDPVAAIGVLGLPTQVRGSIAIGGGAGQVERRQVTEAQMAAAREREVEPRHLTAPTLAKPVVFSPRTRATAAETQASRLRGAERHVEVLAARRPASKPEPPPEEETVSEPRADHADPIPDFEVESPDVSLLAVADAAKDAADAFVVYAVAEERYEAARRALIAAWEVAGVDDRPPDRLSVQSIELSDGTLMRAHSDGAPETIAALREMGEVIVDEARASVALDGETQADESVPGYDARAAAAQIVGERAAASGSGEVDDRKADGVIGGGSGLSEDVLSRLTTHQRRVLTLTVEHRGDRAAVASALTLKHKEGVDIVLEAIGRKGLLPIELIPLLPARFAKYTGV